MLQDLSVIDFPDCGQASVSPFDYGDLSTPDVAALEAHAHAIRETVEHARRTTVSYVLKIGQELDAANSRLANHGNGTFVRWCQDVCGCKRTTAHRCLAAYQAFKDCSTAEQSFDVSAIYAFSTGNSSEEARREALTLVEQGEHITQRRAKSLVRKHTAQPAAPAVVVCEAGQPKVVVIDATVTDLEQARVKLEILVAELQGRSIPDLEIARLLRMHANTLDGGAALDLSSRDNTALPVSIVTEPSEGDDPEDVADSSSDARDASESQPAPAIHSATGQPTNTPARGGQQHRLDRGQLKQSREASPYPTVTYRGIPYYGMVEGNIPFTSPTDATDQSWVEAEGAFGNEVRRAWAEHQHTISGRPVPAAQSWTPLACSQ